MIERIYKKSLILGIVVLFIGASIVPSISGYSGKTSAQITNGDPVSFLMSDDYVNAYWKFDEGNGNTAHDSSNHNYDGTIYGATWTTDTPSGSGYALNFDGLDDYVDFDNYAEYYLGFNKTDDAIFSFHFKSSTNNRGIIYSTSRGDQYGYNPGFHIALAANGSIEVKVWRVNCGIWMYTSENFNDGSWHSVEVFYNGQMANPTVDIYTDGQLEKSQKRWVCYFWDDQFHHADMGRNSWDFTNYYEGKIDEFKIINYPGGNEQLPPIIDGPTSGIPGEEYHYTFTVVDLEGDDCEINVDFNGTQTGWMGPYEPGEVVTIGHTWDEIGNYTIRSKSRDRWDEGPWSAPFKVIIGNYPPGAPDIDGPLTGDPGTEYDFVFNAVDPDGDNVKYHINWGDENSESTDFNPSGEDVTVPHTYTSSGVYTIEAYAEDSVGLTGPTSTFQVTMPRNKAINRQLLQFLESHSNMLLILKLLLLRFGL